jgi:hypothetical protein
MSGSDHSHRFWHVGIISGEGSIADSPDLPVEERDSSLQNDVTGASWMRRSSRQFAFGVMLMSPRLS